MVNKDIIRPRSDGSLGYYAVVVIMEHTGKKWVQSNKALTNLITLEYSKDIAGPTGTGSFSIPYRDDYNSIIGRGYRIQVRGDYIKIGQNSNYKNLPLILDGIIKEVHPSRTQIDVFFTDWGVQLEAQADLTAQYQGKAFSGKFDGESTRKAIEKVITMAGLNPKVQWGDNPDTKVTLDYNNTGNSDSESTSTGVDGSNCVSYTGVPTCNQHSPSEYYSTGPHYWSNVCPFCGGLLKAGIKRSDEITCSKCGADFCGVCGQEKLSNPRKWLTKCGKTSPTTDTDLTSNTAGSGPTWWDILMDLIESNNSNLDLEVFIYGANCYVVQPPAPSENPPLLIDDTINLISGSVRRTEADPESVNTVIVNYGKGKTTRSVITVDEEKGGRDFVTIFASSKVSAINSQLYLVNNKPITVQYDKPDMNSSQAKVYAERMLRKIQRDNGFEIECQVIGSAHWYPGLWCQIKHSMMSINDVYFITRTNFRMDEGRSPEVDVTLANYLPTYESTGSDSDSNNDVQGTIDRIGAEEAKFENVQGVCSNETCFVENGYGDCWASSEWLTGQLRKAGIKTRIMGYRGGNYPRHAWVQINTNGTWVDWDYKKYNSQHYGNTATGTPFVVVDENESNYSLLGKGI